MTENERFREARKALGMSVKDIASVLGVQSSAISKIEHGQTAVTQRTKAQLRQTLGVREDWIATGDGPMLAPGLQTQDEQLDVILEKEGLNEDEKTIVREFVRLPPEDRQAVLRYAKALAAKLGDGEKKHVETWEERRERLHRELDRQLESEERSALSATSQSA